MKKLKGMQHLLNNSYGEYNTQHVMFLEQLYEMTKGRVRFHYVCVEGGGGKWCYI